MPLIPCVRPEDEAAFSGSYAPVDVEILLRRLPPWSRAASPAERFVLRCLGPQIAASAAEPAPTPESIRLYEDALDLMAIRIARNTARLAYAIVGRHGRAVSLASLGRSGVPFGVLLRRALSALKCDAAHFCLAPTPTGPDPMAVRHITAQRPHAPIIMVDSATRGFFQRRELALVTLCDPFGSADLASTAEDWIIPAGLVGSAGCGMMSEAILSSALTESGSLQGCVDLGRPDSRDLSRDFVDRIWSHMRARLVSASAATWSLRDRDLAASAAAESLDRIQTRYGPGCCLAIGVVDATRAVLRRGARRLILPAGDAPATRPLRRIAVQAGVPVDLMPPAAFSAVSLL